MRQNGPQGKAMNLSIWKNAHLYIGFGYDGIINPVEKSQIYLSNVQESKLFLFKICLNNVKMLHHGYLPAALFNFIFFYLCIYI